ncbi:MAG: 3-isopropylmalate dehydratase small subunit [Peptococcaceae bacterium]|nr:3-isopropylmalate dehydratase small subunit [Peptococcaceae bacterium]
MKAWKVGNNIDTDLIIAARYLNDASDENMKAHCMEDVIPDYANTIAAGDVLVAGSNFGCGSSREHAPISIKVAGTSCVIAESFARIFYRNAINIGLPIIESPEAAKAIDQGDELDINFEEGIIQNLTKNENYHFEKFPEFIQQLVVAGNLLNYVKAKVYK